MLPNEVVRSDDLARFISQLAEQANTANCDWENDTLPRYLDALSGCADAVEQGYVNMEQDMSKMSPWRIFADLLYAATMYE